MKDNREGEENFDDKKAWEDLEETNHVEKTKSLVRQCVETLLYFVFIIGAVFLLQTYVVQPVEVDGESMLTTLSHEDHLLLEKVSYRFHEPRRFDVIVFTVMEGKEEKYYIKRIIGLPGETIRIHDHVIYVNGAPLEEDFGKDEFIRNNGIASEEIHIGEDEYFVLGDNRNNSKDSRTKSVGLVEKSSILGKAWFRVWPISKLGGVRHK